jgi:alcohol dehydrogenase class IV
VPHRIRKIGEIFGAEIPDDASPEQIGKITGDKMRSFMSLVGIQSFEQMGISKKDVVDRTDALMQEFMIQFCPVPITRDVAQSALERMCDYEGAK